MGNDAKITIPRAMANLIQLMMVMIDERPSDVERITMSSLLSIAMMFLLDIILMLIHYAIINLLFCMSIHNLSLLNYSFRQRSAVQHPPEMSPCSLLYSTRMRRRMSLHYLGGGRVRRA